MRHVLIIEDDQVIASLIGTILEDEGATSIKAASTEAEAVTAALAQTPGLIVSDVRLRSGTGPRAVATIRDAVGPVPVIFITGAIDEAPGCDAGDVILSNPFSCNQLTRTYNDYVAPEAR